MVKNETWGWLLEGFRLELETAVKPKTVEYYLYPARIFARWAQNDEQVVDPRLIAKRDIQRFFHQLLLPSGSPSASKANHSDRTKWSYYRSPKRFFNWAFNESYVGKNPVEGIELKAPKAPPVEPYRPDHVEQMLRLVERDWQVARTPRQRMLAARDRAILLLFIESGLRLSELAGLKVADVDLERQRALVREGKMGKGRMVGFGTQTKKALWRYFGLRAREVGSGALWLTEEFTPLTKHGVQMIVRRLKRDAGLQHVKGSVHKLRHTFATTYLRHTRDMKGCRLLMGHATLAMTERYTEFIEAEDALKAYDEKGPMDWLRG